MNVDVGGGYKGSREQVRAHQTLLALTVLTLTCFLKHSSAKAVAIDMINDVECCKAVTNKIHIPVDKVTNVTMTSNCKLKAIIVSTEAKKKICLDPEWKHAQMHVAKFKKKSQQSGALKV